MNDLPEDQPKDDIEVNAKWNKRLEKSYAKAINDGYLRESKWSWVSEPADTITVPEPIAYPNWVDQIDKAEKRDQALKQQGRAKKVAELQRQYEEAILFAPHSTSLSEAIDRLRIELELQRVNRMSDTLPIDALKESIQDLKSGIMLSLSNLAFKVEKNETRKVAIIDNPMDIKALHSCIRKYQGDFPLPDVEFLLEYQTLYLTSDGYLFGSYPEDNIDVKLVVTKQLKTSANFFLEFMYPYASSIETY